jgi:hypothetical protein
MAKTLTEAASFDADITIPQDGEAATMTSLEPPLQKLTNRSKYLRDEVRPAGGAARTIVINIGLARDQEQTATRLWKFSDTVPLSLQTVSNLSELSIPLSMYLPSGATLTRVRAVVDPGVARATVGNRMRMDLDQHVHNFASPAAPTRTGIFSVRDDGTTNVQVIDSGVLAVAIDKSNKTYDLIFIGGNDSGTNIDSLYSVELQFTDPGPKSH